MHAAFRPTLALLLAWPLAGCIHSRETIYEEPDRTPVRFETPQAGLDFYETLSKNPEAYKRTTSKAGVNLILIDIDRETVTGPNAFFNRAVAACDTDQNGVISETEATLFAKAPFNHRP